MFSFEEKNPEKYIRSVSKTNVKLFNWKQNDYMSMACKSHKYQVASYKTICYAQFQNSVNKRLF